MRRVPIVAVLLVGLSGLGCRNAGNHELLERELRRQEDRISDLEYELQKAREQLQGRCQDGSVILREADPPMILPRRSSAIRHPAAGDASRTTTPPKVELPSGEAAPPYQGPPAIQPPSPDFPEGELPGRAAPDAAPSPRESATPEPAPLEAVTRPANLPVPRAGDDRAEELVPPGQPASPDEVSEIAIIRDQTGRRTVPGAARDESVVVVVEPRAGNGQPIQAAGAIAIVVLDLEKNGADARLARWDFSAGEATRQHGHAVGSAQMRFELRWPNGPPKSSSLQLFVRLTTPDGRKLVADTELTKLAASHHTGQSQPSGGSAIRLVADAQPLPEANWRRSRRPLPRIEEEPLRMQTIPANVVAPPASTPDDVAPAGDTSPEHPARPAPPQHPGEAREPRRLPDDLLRGDGARPLVPEAPPGRDERAWAPYR